MVKKISTPTKYSLSENNIHFTILLEGKGSKGSTYIWELFAMQYF